MWVRPVNLKFSKRRVLDFFVKNLGAFWPKQRNFKISKEFNPGIFLYFFSRTNTKNTVISLNFLVLKFCRKAQYPHIFGCIARILIYLILNAGMIILLYSTKICYLMVVMRILYLTEINKHLQTCWVKKQLMFLNIFFNMMMVAIQFRFNAAGKKNLLF